MITSVKNVFLFVSIGLLFLCFSGSDFSKKKVVKNEINKVTVTIIDTGEKEEIELKSHQTAQIKVFLSSLGDMLGEYMVTLTDISRQKTFSNLLTDDLGEVIFRKVPPGDYAVYLNKKVATEEQERSTVRVSDVILKAYP